MKSLTLEIASTLIGKTIKWQAPANSLNHPYGGLALITNVITTNKCPISADKIEGDFLSYAFTDYNGNDFCYSDNDRYITFETI